MPRRLSGGEYESPDHEQSIENARIIFLQECAEKEPAILRELVGEALMIWKQNDTFFKQVDYDSILQWANPAGWPDDLVDRESTPAMEVRIAIRLCLAKFHLEEDWIIERAFLTVRAWAQDRWPLERGWFFSGSYVRSESLPGPGDWLDMGPFGMSEQDYRARIEEYIEKVKTTRKDQGVVKGREIRNRAQFEWLAYRQVLGYTARKIIDTMHLQAQEGQTYWRLSLKPSLPVHSSAEKMQ
jgi:hypothetical protein